MKTIIMLDTDNREIIEEFKRSWNKDMIVIPMGIAKIYIINDNGETISKIE